MEKRPNKNQPEKEKRKIMEWNKKKNEDMGSEGKFS